MDHISRPPSPSSMIVLADHQSRTPSSFYSGPTVLHYHSQRCKVLAVERDLHSSPVLSAICGNENASTNLNGSAVESEKEIVIENVDVWVASDKLHLYVPSSSAGISIHYPSISLHAIQRLRLPGSAEDGPEVQCLYMQIAIPTSPAGGAVVNVGRGEEDDEDDEDENSIALTIVPPPDSTASGDGRAADDGQMTGVEDVADVTPAQVLYDAVSACSNLHPDPATDEEDGMLGSSLFRSGLVGAGVGDGGLPPPVEGSPGWITAENMHEFFDSEGNWITSGEEPTLPLGPGAGTVRERGDSDGEGHPEENENEGEGAKWRRTD